MIHDVRFQNYIYLVFISGFELLVFIIERFQRIIHKKINSINICL